MGDGLRFDEFAGRLVTLEGEYQQPYSTGVEANLVNSGRARRIRELERDIVDNYPNFVDNDSVKIIYARLALAGIEFYRRRGVRSSGMVSPQFVIDMIDCIRSEELVGSVN